MHELNVGPDLGSSECSRAIMNHFFLKICLLSMQNVEGGTILFCRKVVNWTICATVVKVQPKCTPKKINAYVQQFFKCWVKDNTATIQVLAYNADADVFEGKLPLNEVLDYVKDSRSS